MGDRGRADDEAILTRLQARLGATAVLAVQRTRGRRALQRNGHDETTLACPRRAPGARLCRPLRACGRRGPDADLPRGAAQRSGDCRREGDVGRDAGKAPAGAGRPAARRLAVGQRELQQLRRDDQERSPGRHQPELRIRQRDGVGVAAVVPLSERRRGRPGTGLRDAGGLRAGRRRAGPDPPRRDRVLRRAARAVQHRAQRQPEGSRVRAACPGEAQLRGGRRDDHRHQRGAGEVRLDRRAGDHDAQRVRQPGHGAPRDHRPVSEGPEEGRRRPASAAPAAEHARLLGRQGHEGKPQRADRAVQLRHRDARSRPREGGQLSDARPRRQL